MKIYSDLIKASFEKTTGAIATLLKGLLYFRTDVNRPFIDDGTTVDQLMMEKHLPEARRNDKVELDSAGTGIEVTGSLPLAQGGTAGTTQSTAMNNVLPAKAGQALKVLQVNAGETDYELVVQAALGSIDGHSDVDTTTIAPNINEGLGWDGSNWVPTVFGLEGIDMAEIAILSDSKPNATASGTFTNGADRTRDIVRIDHSQIWVSLLANQFTLTGGSKYTIIASVPANEVNSHQAFAYDITNTVELIPRGSSARAAAGTAATHSFIRVQVDLTASPNTTYEIRHRCQTTVATFGFGWTHGAAIPGEETYTQIMIIKE